MKNLQVIQAWLQGLDATNAIHSLYSEDNVIYSYGKHFPIARITQAGIVLVTTDSYSNTTAAHVSLVRNTCPGTVYNVPLVIGDDTKTIVLNTGSYLSRVLKLKMLIVKARKETTREFYRGRLAQVDNEGCNYRSEFLHGKGDTL